MKYSDYDVCIIGGGAAGLAAAASFCKSSNYSASICILEKNDSVGKKLLATGGGKCNITNARCKNKDIVIDFFNNLDLELWQDNEGRYYPYSAKASDVLKVLKKTMIEGKLVKINCGFCVTDIEYVQETSGIVKNNCFKIYGRCENEIICASKVILALGGKAAPQFGTCGDGYALAKKLGHNVSKVYPILTGVECHKDGADFSKLKGIRARGNVKLIKDGEEIEPYLNHESSLRNGEIQFTADGISGICVFDLTPNIVVSDGESRNEAMKRYQISIDFAPDFNLETLEKRESSFGILTEELAKVVDINEIKDWRVQVTGVKGWRDAQATHGGILLDEINSETMESKIVNGLYFAGEILDIQGPCGGYNLQNAFETGIKVAKKIASEE